jgi:DNA polymerase III delta prime subunit
LTIDAQSALRRCIEQFSFNTRFFIIIENKHKLLKPI